MSEKGDLHVREQLAAGIVSEINAERMADLEIQTHAQDWAFDRALEEIQRVRNFVGSPENILGRQDTKHGEIAEQVEVGVRRAWDALNQRDFSANIDDIPRTGPADYQIDGIDVQSKFYNGLENTIRNGVEKHLEDYPWFGSDGRYYHIPADQYGQMESILHGETPDGLSERTASRIREHLQELSEKTGRPVTDLIRPSVSDYPEVQQGKIHETIADHENQLRDGQEQKHEQIQSEHRPNLGDAATGAAIAGVLAAGLNLTAGIYRKHKQGVSVFELSTEDWKELGVDSAKAGAGGALTAAAIYGLTNYAEMSAPLAGAVASAARGIWVQAKLYREGKLTRSALIENSLVVSSEAGFVAAGAALGQAIIPVPVLGAVVGSIGAKFAAGLLTAYLHDTESSLGKELESKITLALSKLEAKHQALVERILRDYGELRKLIDYAFSCEENQRVAASIELATSLGVPKERIITNAESLDRYMRS